MNRTEQNRTELKYDSANTNIDILQWDINNIFFIFSLLFFSYHLHFLLFYFIIIGNTVVLFIFSKNIHSVALFSFQVKIFTIFRANP